MSGRIKKIFEDTEADIAIVMNGSNVDMTFFYVTGLENGLFENSIAILYPDGSSEVICPELEESAGEGAHAFSTNREKMSMLKEHIHGDKIGINGDIISHNDFTLLSNLFPEADFLDIGQSIKKARMVKDRKEIETIKKACRIAYDASLKINSFLNEGIKESEVRAELEYSMSKEGAIPSFDTIVAFGKNSSLPHYSTGGKTLEFPVLVDFGARCRRYCSDMTRTFVSGREQKGVHEKVMEGQEIAFDMMRSGIKAIDIHNAVENFLIKNGFGKLIHSLGHSIGLEVHDGFSMKEDTVLREGMVITVEPGIYFKDRWGIRIEDDVLVKKNDIEILTKK